jgi:hypothetical protein
VEAEVKVEETTDEETKESPPAEPKELSNEEVTPVPDEDLKDAAVEETTPISSGDIPEDKSPPGNEVATEEPTTVTESDSRASDKKEEEIAVAEPEVEPPTPEVTVVEEEPSRADAPPKEYTSLDEGEEKKEEPFEEQPQPVERVPEKEEDHKDEAHKEALPDEASSPDEEQPQPVEKAPEKEEDHKDEAPEEAIPDEASSPAVESANTDEVATLGTTEEASSKEFNSGIWLFTDRENITHFFEPNFLPPYDTPEKRKIIMDVLREEWDEKTLSWRPCGQGSMTKPLTLENDLLSSKELNEDDKPQTPKEKIDEMFGEVLSKITLVCGSTF